MALKLCTLCNPPQPYGKGRGSRVRHLKEFHPDEYRRQFDSMVEGRNRKAQQQRPPPKPQASHPPEQQLPLPEKASDSARGGDLDSSTVDSEDLDPAARDFLDAFQPDPPGKSGGSGQDKGGQLGGTVPKTARTTKVLSEASEVAFVPRVYTVSSATVFQAREICIKEFGWPANWSFEDWLDTFIYLALKSWGVVIAPYVVLPQEEAANGDKVLTG